MANDNNLNVVKGFGEALGCFVVLADGNWDEVTHMVLRVNDDPSHCRRVFTALTGIDVQMVEPTQEEWVRREKFAFKRLVKVGIPIPTEAEIAAEWFEGCMLMHRFVPGGLRRLQLLKACHKVGIKVNFDVPAIANFDGRGEQLPTERGTLECDLERMMQSTDGKHRPFNLDGAQHDEWAKEEGGDGYTSAEEALYLKLRARVELGRVPFMGGDIRCRNRCNCCRTGCSLKVEWSVPGGVDVRHEGLGSSRWSLGALVRKFRPSAVA